MITPWKGKGGDGGRMFDGTQRLKTEEINCVVGYTFTSRKKNLPYVCCDAALVEQEIPLTFNVMSPMYTRKAVRHKSRV